MLFACGPQHRLAKRRAIDISQLAGERFIDFDKEWAIRRISDRIFEQADVERDTAMVVNDVHLLLGFVAHGLGVALVPEVFRRFPEQVSYLPLQSAKHSDVRLVVACANREPPSAAVRALHTIIAEAVATEETAPPEARSKANLFLQHPTAKSG